MSEFIPTNWTDLPCGVTASANVVLKKDPRTTTNRFHVVQVLPKPLAAGEWRGTVAEATRANAGQDRAETELAAGESGGVQNVGRSFVLERVLTPNSITLLELRPTAKQVGL